jgi:hypothetical protein
MVSPGNNYEIDFAFGRLTMSGVGYVKLIIGVVFTLFGVIQLAQIMYVVLRELGVIVLLRISEQMGLMLDYEPRRDL